MFVRVDDIGGILRCFEYVVFTVAQGMADG